jgi:hypothetical protein
LAARGLGLIRPRLQNWRLKADSSAPGRVDASHR